jgi:hypothetical protein
MKILCLFGIHCYKHKFIPYADQPFLTNNVKDELCCVEGTHICACKYCGKKMEG